MKLTDAIALAKAGYKKADIELMLLSNEEPDQKPDPAPDQTPEPVNSKVEDITPDDPGDDKKPEEEPGIDYEKMYKETQKELETMRDQIRKIQEDNRHRDNGIIEDKEQERLNDIFRSYM